MTKNKFFNIRVDETAHIFLINEKYKFGFPTINDYIKFKLNIKPGGDKK